MKLENEIRYEVLIKCAEESGHLEEIHQRIDDWYENTLDDVEFDGNIDNMMLDELEHICLEYGRAV